MLPPARAGCCRNTLAFQYTLCGPGSVAATIGAWLQEHSGISIHALRVRSRSSTDHWPLTTDHWPLATASCMIMNLLQASKAW